MSGATGFHTIALCSCLYLIFQVAFVSLNKNGESEYFSVALILCFPIRAFPPGPGQSYVFWA